MEEQIKPIAVKPAKAFQLLDLSRSMGYRMLATGEIQSIRIGKAIRVPIAALEEFMSRKLKQSEMAQRGDEE